MRDEQNATIERLMFTVDEAAIALRICRDMIYRAIRDGRLLAKRDGRRTLIPKSALDAYVDRLPDISPEDLADRTPASKRAKQVPVSA